MHVRRDFGNLAKHNDGVKICVHVFAQHACMAAFMCLCMCVSCACMCVLSGMSSSVSMKKRVKGWVQ